MRTSICVAVITGFPSALHFLNDGLLNQRNALQVDFHTQVSTCNHHGIRNGKNLIDIGNGRLLFDFRDDRRMAPGSSSSQPLSPRCPTQYARNSVPRRRLPRPANLHVLAVLGGHGVHFDRRKPAGLLPCANSECRPR